MDGSAQTKEKIYKDFKGKTSFEIEKDIILYYDPNIRCYLLEDLNREGSYKIIKIPVDIMDALYNKAWEDE